MLFVIKASTVDKLNDFMFLCMFDTAYVLLGIYILAICSAFPYFCIQNCFIHISLYTCIMIFCETMPVYCR